MPEFVCTIGEVKYATLQAAIDAVEKTGTIVLAANTKENVKIPAGKEIILDLNGFTLSGGTDSEPEHKDKPAIFNEGTLTVKDSATAGMIKRDDNSPDSYYVIDNQGIMTIESGYIYNNSGSEDPSQKGGSSLIRNGGSPNAEVTYEPDYAKLYIKGGKLEQNNFIAIKNDEYGYVEMTGGEVISASESALQNWSNAKVSGGTINGLVWILSYDQAKSGAVTNFSGDAVVNGKIWAENYDTKKGKKAAVISIDGGKYHLATSQTPKDGPAFRVLKGGDIKVSGGNFDIDPADFKAEDVSKGGVIAISGGSFNVDPTPFKDPNAEFAVDPQGNFYVPGTPGAFEPGIEIVPGSKEDPNMQDPTDPMYKHDPNAPVEHYPPQPAEQPSVSVAFVPKYATRKAYEKIIMPSDFVSMIDMITPRKITALLDTCHVAIVANDKYYPVNEDNFEEQFALAKAGSELTVAEDPDFGIKDLYCFTKASVSEVAEKIMSNAVINSGLIYGNCIEVTDYKAIAVDAITENGYWIVFNFDLAAAEAEGYSEIKLFDGREVIQGDNFININDVIPMGISAKLTCKDGSVHDVKARFGHCIKKFDMNI